MNRLFTVSTCAVVCLLLAFATSSAQQTGMWERIDTVDMQYFGQYRDVLASADESHFAVIGTMNDLTLARLVRTTTDGGTTWNVVRRDLTPGEQWMAVAHPDPNLIVVVGDSAEFIDADDNINPNYRYQGLLLVSTDAGATWSRHLSDSNIRYQNISMCDAQHGVILQWNTGNKYNNVPNSYPDSLLRTTDGWKTWTSVALPENFRYSTDLICIEPDVYVVKVRDHELQQYFLLRTTDGGASWTRSAPLPAGCDGISFLDAETGWAAGGIRTGVGDQQRDMIYRSTDGGMNWEVMLDGQIGLLPFGLISVDFADADNGIAAGRPNRLLRTHDGGATWVEEFPPSNILLPYPPHYIEYVRPDFAMIAYNGAAIIRHTGVQTLLPPMFTKPISTGPLDVNGITVEWTPIDGATEYRIQIAPQSLQSSVYDSTVYANSIVDTVIPGTSVVLNGIDYNSRFYCRVKSRNATRESDWHRREGLFYTKKDAGTVEPPKIITPEAGALGQPTSLTVTWGAVPGAVSYDLQIASDPIFLVPVVNVTLITGTSWDVTGLEPGTTYYVRVRAHLASQTTDWSSAASPHVFITGAPAGSVDDPRDVTPGTITVSPNPMTGEAFADLSGFASGHNVRLTIHNALGEVVRTVAVTEEKLARFDVTGLSAGTYHLRAISGGRSVSIPIIIIR